MTATAMRGSSQYSCIQQSQMHYRDQSPIFWNSTTKQKGLKVVWGCIKITLINPVNKVLQLYEYDSSGLR